MRGIESRKKRELPPLSLRQKVMMLILVTIIGAAFYLRYSKLIPQFF